MNTEVQNLEPARPGAMQQVGAIATGLLRILLGAALIFAGIGHLTFGRSEFLAQVPPWLPLNGDFVVVSSGIVEIALGLALIFARQTAGVGWPGHGCVLHPHLPGQHLTVCQRG